MTALRTWRPGTGSAWVSTAVRLVLGTVLLVAGVLKAVDPAGTVQAVRAYQLLPAGVDTLVGWGQPFVEIALGLLLVAGIAIRPVALATGLLLIILIAAVISVAARGLRIDCGCFGGGGPVPPGQTAYGREILRDVGLLMLAIWLVVQPRSRLALDRTGKEER